jgi:signal transduction histidine kinase
VIHYYKSIEVGKYKQRMTIKKSIFNHMLVKSVIIFCVGVGLGVVACLTVDQVYRSYLASRANTLAQAFDAQKVASLKSSITEVTAPNYNEIRTKLALIREVNSDVRFVYLMAKDKNSMYFLADSEPESSSDHSPNGEQYNDASPELQRMFDIGGSLIEGPLQDDWGTWLSALAPIIDPTTQRVVAVVGLDVPATQYLTVVTSALLAPIIVVSALIVFLAVNSTSRRRRREALQFRSELVSIASHELRTPLTGIRWAAEALRGDSLSENQQILTESIHNSVLHLEESIEDILQLASIENSSKMDSEPNDMTILFQDTFAMQTLPAQKKGIALLLDKSWPARLVIVCDALRMRRVLNNLISNAVKYSKDNSRVVVGYKKVNDRHCISIADKGIGIPKPEQDKIFSGFFRASNAVKSEVNGTGMGLYLSRAIIEQHGGTMWVESVENEGTTVYISLPQVDEKKASKHFTT